MGAGGYKSYAERSAMLGDAGEAKGGQVYSEIAGELMYYGEINTAFFHIPCSCGEPVKVDCDITGGLAYWRAFHREHEIEWLREVPTIHDTAYYIAQLIRKVMKDGHTCTPVWGAPLVWIEA